MKIIPIVFLATVLLLIGCKQVIEDPIFKECIKSSDVGKCVEKKIAELPKDFDCKTIQTEELRAYCYGYFAKLNKDTELCKNLQGKYRNICVSEVSEVSTDPKICDELGRNDKITCLSNVYTNLAVETHDSSPCYNLESDFRYKCITTMAVVLKNQSICNDIAPIPEGLRSPQYVCKEWAVKQIAIASNDVSICKEFKFEGNQYLEARIPKALCIEQAARCNKNEKLCESLDEGVEECKRSITTRLPGIEGQSGSSEDGIICDFTEVVKQ